MSLKNCYWGGICLVLAGMSLVVIGSWTSPLLIGMGVLLCGIAIGIEARFWRCPHCGEKLNQLHPWRDDYCARCGEKLDWEEKQSWR